MLLPHILHLVDDASPGGVTRVLQHLSRCRIWRPSPVTGWGWSGAARCARPT